MAKLTTLQYVQRALSAIDSDNVSDVAEGVESEQVLLLLNTVYEQLYDDFPWYHLRSYGNLQVTTVPNEMTIPDGVRNIDGDLIRYNKKNVWYIAPDAMQAMLDGRDTIEANIDSLGAVTDRDPLYWTTEDDTTIIFDSYNSTLASSLSRVWFVSTCPALVNNTDKPQLPDLLHGVLLNGLLEETFRTLKGDEGSARVYARKYITGLSKAKRWARRQDKVKTTNGVNYGRRNVGGASYISGRQYIQGV